MFLRDVLPICVILHCSLSFYKCVKCKLVIKPDNVASKNGEVVTFQCASDVSKGNIAWNTISPGSTRRDIIYNNYILASSVSSYISVSDRNDGNCSLHINASLTAAKRYICMERDSGDEASAELLVVDSASRCNSTVINNKNSVDVSCSITSAGVWAPVVICRECGELGEYVLKGNQVENIWTFNGNDLLLSIYCWTKFEWTERPTETSAFNVPEDVWIYAYQPVNKPDGCVIVVVIAVIITVFMTIIVILVVTFVILCWHSRKKRFMHAATHDVLVVPPALTSLIQH